MLHKLFFFSSRRRHTRWPRDWSSDVCSSDLLTIVSIQASAGRRVLEHDPAATAQALERIESTAREALEELDAVLAQLRDEQTGKPSGRRNAAAFDAADSGAGDSGDRKSTRLNSSHVAIS